ncbi:beta-1,3-galactosyltransferase 4-like [Ornithodoros turicata]|uniref:beta-1,3-galactosyltransferase 4-like n=1 Tax=Ornithodoros turicata TaxID=34597 RepID=UPI00313918C6
MYSSEVMVRPRCRYRVRSRWLFTASIFVFGLVSILTLRRHTSSRSRTILFDSVAPYRGRSYIGTRATYKFNHSPPNGTCVLTRKDTATFVILVGSAPHHFPLRNAIRGTWGREARNSGFVVVFVTGKPPPSSKEYEWQLGLDTEAAVNRDILQGTFIGTYGTMTMLNILGLKWAAEACGSADFLVKISDDTYLNVKRLKQSFENVRYKSAVVYARVDNSDTHWNGHRLARARQSICVPCGYALSMDVVPMLFNSSLTGSFNSMEDLFWAHTTGTTVKLESLLDFGTYIRGVTTQCEVRNLITSHQLNAYDMEVMWRELRNANSSCSPSNKDEGFR